MTEALPLTDTELRLKEIEAKWQTRREEAERTGKPIPPHIIRWYQKQIAEARAAMQRVISSLLPKEDLQAHIIARITAVKHQQDAKIATVQAKAKKAEPAEPKRPKSPPKTPEQRREEKNAKRRHLYATDPKYREHVSSRMKLKDEAYKERKRTDPVFREQELAKEREYRRRKVEQMKSDPVYQQKVLAMRERQMELKATFYQVRNAHEAALLRAKAGVPSAKDLVAEAAVAEAIEAGTLAPEEETEKLQQIRIITAVIEQKYQLTKSEKDAIRRTEKRRLEKQRTLLDQSIEVGWAKKAVKRDPELRAMFEASVNASYKAAVWNYERGGVQMSEKLKAMKREEFVQKLYMQLDANHNLLHERRAHRNASLQRSWEKHWDELRADPERYAAYKEEKRQRYYRVKAQIEARPPAEGPCFKDSALQALEQARKDAPKT